MEIRIRASGATDVGRVRRTNEDALGFDVNRGLFVVCDGVGGSAAGEIASQSAVNCVMSEFPGEVAGPDDGGSELERAIQAASRSIYRAAQREPLYQGMATTIVAAYLDGARMWIAHVGDSRAYLIRGEQMHRLTDDHSQLAELLREREATAEEQSTMDGVLTQALGAFERVLPAVTTLPVELGDCFVLATDGITKSFTLAEMHELVLTASSPEEACELLIAGANARGGEDNSTCIFIVID